jgi:predicted nuclease of predicted toxin-antitoxin system
MRILADMNIPVDWIPVLESHGWQTVHWSEVGNIRAALLAVTHAQGPSVIQIRAQDIMPTQMEQIVTAALRQFEGLLEQGALISIDPFHARARVLPLRT